MALTVSPSTSWAWQPITLTANVTTDGGSPTGSVAFFDGSIHLGTATLNAGRAVLTTPLVSGSHALRAEYGGAATFASSSSPVVTQVVSLPAAFIYPSYGATNVDLTQPFTWTTVEGAQAYYLYVGSTFGGKDLVNTGEMQQTSYRPPLTLATGATLYARLWTKLGGTWRFVDTTFSAPAIARFTYPAANITAFEQPIGFAWTAVPNAEAYYLYIGSSSGAKDLVNTGQIQQTWYSVTAILPINQDLFARLWTKAGGVWRFTDRTFRALAPFARFTTPSGAATFDPAQPFAWTSIADAQAYYLYVGSSLGAKDLVNSGEITATSYRVSSLPIDQPLYARLWTRYGGVWRYVDITFTATAATDLHFSYPAAGASYADMSQAFAWTPVADVQAYYLYVGTALGRKDLVNTGEIHATSYLAANLLVNQPLYARLWAKVANAWHYIDRVITPIPSSATVIGFSGVTINGSAVGTYTESGFNVSAASGGWVGVTTYGHPAPYIDFSAPEGSTVAGEVRVSAGGATFTFNAVDLYPSTTPIPYTITGVRNSSTVFRLTGTLPNTYGAFRTILNPDAAAVIDSLSIVLVNTNPLTCCGASPMGLDTIVLTR